ncbi:cytochrome P450 [Artemisia annua]|uniref:Cytochrome P450 n=1 Tax=Artemisia annua TaxID=35608 RepID=A0A2U1N408_ARTAN|nr:cytochrome P450 [Artemisia annua]
MTELLLNPHMFSRVRDEVSTTVGKDGKINETKILSLPYLHATIKETMIPYLSTPLLVPHKAEIEVQLGEDIYIVPKGTQSYGIARDARYWEDPLVFNPERLLGYELDYEGHNF